MIHRAIFMSDGAAMLLHWLSCLVGRGIPEIDGRELVTRLRTESSVLIDVRTADQFVAGHLPGALHAPADRLAAAAGRLNRAAPVVVY